MCSKGSTTGNNCHHDRPLPLSFTRVQPCGPEELSSTRSNWVGIRSMHACTEHWQVPWSVELGTGPNQGFTCLSCDSGWPPAFPLALLHEELYVLVWAVWNPDQGVWLWILQLGEQRNWATWKDTLVSQAPNFSTSLICRCQRQESRLWEPTWGSSTLGSSAFPPPQTWLTMVPAPLQSVCRWNGEDWGETACVQICTFSMWGVGQIQ